MLFTHSEMELLVPDSPINPPSAEAVAGNEDLLAEILLRLPVKPLLRFKSVSKLWRSLIADPSFARRHIRRRSSLSGLFLRRNKTHFDFVSVDGKGKGKKLSSSPFPFPFLSLDFVDDPSASGIKILQSCNGLFLCSTFHQIGTTRKYYIYNPSTHHFSALPPPDCGASVSVFGVNLAFEPLKSAIYEVVMVRSTPASIYSYQIEVYSSEARSWRPCGGPFSAPFDLVFDNGVFWNGAIHWLSPSGASMYFDISQGSLGMMPRLPISGNRSKRSSRYFGESRGHLHLIEVYGPQATNFDVYELERDYSRWVVKYQIDLEALAIAFPEMVREHLDPCYLSYYAFKVLFVAREGIHGDCSLLVHIPGKVISYNAGDKVYEKLCELHSESTNTSLQFGWFDAYPFIESLACV